MARDGGATNTHRPLITPDEETIDDDYFQSYQSGHPPASR